MPSHDRLDPTEGPPPTFREMLCWCCGCFGCDDEIGTSEVHITHEVASCRAPDNDERVSIAEDRGPVVGGTGATIGCAVGRESDALKSRASAALAKARASEQARASARASGRASHADVELVEVGTERTSGISRGSCPHGSAGTTWYDR